MCLESPFQVGSACALLWLSATALHGQDTQPAPAQAIPEPPRISDQPKTIDPAAFMPAQLSATATVDFTDSSLREVLNWLREEQNLVVLLENDALSEIGVLPGDPISDRLDEASIYLLLNRLRSLGLAWYFEDEVLHLTSVEVAEDRLTTIPHSIGDLLDVGYDVDTLALVIENAIAPESWESNGGSGVVSFLGDVMFVRQTDNLQREVRGLLVALRDHGRQTFALDPPEHSRLRQKLNQNVTVAFRDTPLETAVRQLAEMSQVDIRLDMPALRANGVRERAPTTVSLTERKLKTVLQAMLIDHDLTWVLRDGVLWITSHDEADEFLKTAVYDVRDLCRDNAESDALSNAIISQTKRVWEEDGGAGTIQFARPGTLVIHNTESALSEVLLLLETYRTALRTSEPRRSSEEDPDQVVTTYYRMHANVARDLKTQLPRLVRPKSWKSAAQPNAEGEVFLVSSPPDLPNVDTATSTALEAQHAVRKLVTERAVLIIRQTRAAHAEIEEVIGRVESGDTPMMLGMMGGGFGGGFFSVRSDNPDKQPE